MPPAAMPLDHYLAQETTYMNTVLLACLLVFIGIAYWFTEKKGGTAYWFTEKKGKADKVCKTPLALQLPEGYMIKGGKLLPIGTLTELPDAVRPLVAGGGIPRRILAFLPPLDIGVDSLRVVSRGGWMFVERNLQIALVDGLLSPETTCGRLYQKWLLESSPTGAPATGAEKMALCRGLQKKAVMINLLNELQVEDVNVDAPLKEWRGVTVGADGQVVEIDFSNRCKGGNIGQLNLPVGMQSVNFEGCEGLKGAVDKLVLPQGMQSVDFTLCRGLTGTAET